MTLAQLGGIIWSGRWRLLLCTLAALVGTLVISTRLPKSYEAKARVLLELAQPDPVTGISYDRKTTDTYIRTQQLLATSDRVAQGVIDKLGWANNPAVIEAWQAQTGGTGDIRSWAAQRLLGEAAAYPLEGGGTLEIVYRAPEPEAAETITRFLRESYIETTLALQNEAAARRADRFEALVGAGRNALTKAEAELVATQKATGILVNGRGDDIENDLLARMQTDALGAQQAAARRIRDAQKPENDLLSITLRQDLATTEQQLSLAANTLGVDNPNYRRLQVHRAELLVQIARAGAGARSEAASISGVARQLAREPETRYQAERDRVLSRGPANLKVDQARSLVELRRTDLTRLETNLANARQISDRTESGLVVMGDVITNPEPVFPNIPLNALLAALFGFGLGLSSVLIDGLWRREVHGPADLAGAAGVPVLAVLPGADARRRRLRWPRFRRRGGAVPA